MRENDTLEFSAEEYSISTFTLQALPNVNDSPLLSGCKIFNHIAMGYY